MVCLQFMQHLRANLEQLVVFFSQFSLQAHDLLMIVKLVYQPQEFADLCGPQIVRRLGNTSSPGEGPQAKV
jgi:hypothetical protein